MGIIKGCWKVTVTEYERGWGSKIIDSVSYDNEKQADEHAARINSKNTSESAPDYYIQASVDKVA